MDEKETVEMLRREVEQLRELLAKATAEVERLKEELRLKGSAQ